MNRERPPRSVIKETYKKDNYRCQNCHRRGGEKGDVELHAHHIVPLNDGGSNNQSNLITLCEDCHNAIHTDAEAPTARSGLSTDTDFWKVLVVGSIFTAIKYPVILLFAASIITIIFLIDGQRLIPLFFFITSSIFIGIMQYAKSKGSGGDDLSYSKDPNFSGRSDSFDND